MSKTAIKLVAMRFSLCSQRASLAIFPSCPRSVRPPVVPLIEVDFLLHQPQSDSCTRTSLDALLSSTERALYTTLSTSDVLKSARCTHFGRRRSPFCARLLCGSVAESGAGGRSVRGREGNSDVKQEARALCKRRGAWV